MYKVSANTNIITIIKCFAHDKNCFVLSCFVCEMDKVNEEETELLQKIKKDSKLEENTITGLAILCRKLFIVRKQVHSLTFTTVPTSKFTTVTNVKFTTVINAKFTTVTTSKFTTVKTSKFTTVTGSTSVANY